MRLGRVQTLASEDIQEEDPMDPKVGEHEGQPSFSGLRGDLVCVHCMVGKAGPGSGEGLGLVSPRKIPTIRACDSQGPFCGQLPPSHQTPSN